MSTRFDALVEHRPHAARRIITAGNLAACTIPAGTVLAITTGHTTLALIGAFGGILSYAAGFHAAAWRYVRRLRDQVAAARRDPLTSLPTRAAADQHLRDATHTATDVTVALADVDRLKLINNNLGHAAGDRYILAVTQRLAEAVPEGGSLYRHGGDEFVIVAPGTDPGTLAAAIGAAMTRPAIIAGVRLRPRASVGIAASGGGDATYARACADAALATAKAGGGAHALVYQLDRDGRPAPDGTRPMVRRRDVPPRGFGDLAWLPEPGDELVPVLWTVEQAHIVYAALRAARDRWGQAHIEANAAAAQPQPPTLSTPEHINVRPTPAGYRHIAGLAATEQAKYQHLADQVARLLDAFPDPAGAPPGGANAAAGVVLLGVSAAFTAIEIEGLVRTAAEAVCGDLHNLSSRQRELATRAYALLVHDIED
jgi:diguanylate cyclase (GGDEF)-like protein